MCNKIKRERRNHDDAFKAKVGNCSISNKPGCVAVIGFTKCLAKSTGKTYESDFVHLVSLKDCKIVRFKEFFDTYITNEAFRPE